MEYTIGEFSTISRLSIKTLRYYHEIGLLQPSRVEATSGYRIYDQDCLLRASSIQRLKTLDFSLAEIAAILDRQSAGADLVSLLKAKQAEIEGKLDEYRAIHDRITYSLLIESAVDAPVGEVIVKTIPDILIASHRFRGRYNEIGTVIGRLCTACARVATGKPFSLYYDDQSMEGGADIEVCLPVFEKDLDGQIPTRVLLGGPFLTILHSGPYELIWRSYQKIVDYAGRERVKFGMPNRECYIRGADPVDHYTPLEYLTEIQFPFAG